MIDLPEIGDFWSPDAFTAPRVVVAVVPWGNDWRILFNDGGEPADVDGDPAIGPQPAALLTEAQALALARIDQRSAAVAAAGADTPSGRAKTDAGSRELIIAAHVLALTSISFNATGFRQAFTFIDGDEEREEVLDAAGTLGVGIAVAARINAVRNHAKALVTAVRAATSVDAVEAIDVDGGWPA
ncbi:hypothetical protein GGQ80_000782 [Sphingomonas jinjuensis]|uniref:DUF4376 domain-containing protein n=1 Tax=Sphingomonas jinjuensis TaxID=535907 RepID=A0A840FAT8_9SPHN|nr:hypothetical protein [Sphingomonas jinjuensis]MBB4152894.1 hypothetical protein [Sphingomonas jinjuensis]